MSSIDSNPVEPYGRRWWALVVLCLSLVLIILGNTVLNVALPTLVRELDASATELGWIVDSYALVFAGLLLTAGTIGDRFGRKGALTVGLLIFGGASLASVFATEPWHLIATRAVMGVGAAFVMPATLSILTNIFPANERGRAIAIWAGLAGAGGAVGPVAGGWLLREFAWNSIFFANIPVVVAALVAGYFLVPTSRDPGKPRLDLGGAALSIVGLAALLFAIIEAPDRGWTSAVTLTTFGVAVVVLAGFAVWEVRRHEPMLDLKLFRNPRFSAASAAIAIVFFAMFGSFFLLTQYLQFARGYSPLEAGVRMLPLAAAMMVSAPSSAKAVSQLGTKAVVVTGLLGVGAGLALLSTLDAGSSYGALVAAIVLMGFGMGWTMAPATESIMGSLPLAKAGVGSAVNDTTRELGGALGVAVLGSTFASIYTSSISSDVESLGLQGGAAEAAKDSIGGAIGVAAQLGGADAAQLVELSKASFADAMGITFLIAAGFAVAGAVVALLALPAREAEAEPGPLPEPERLDSEDWVTAGK